MAFRSGVCTCRLRDVGVGRQRAPCEGQDDGTSAAGVGLTGFCLLAIEKHLPSTSLNVCSSKQNALPIQHVKTFLTVSLLVQFPDTYLCLRPYGLCPDLTNQNVCVVFQ